VTARGFNQLNAHNRVVVEETARVRAIRADATYDGGQVNQNLWPMLIKQAFYRVDARKIVLAEDRNEHVSTPHSLEASKQVASKKSGSARHHDSFVG
jgi:hypothetical protein